MASCPNCGQQPNPVSGNQWGCRSCYLMWPRDLLREGDRVQIDATEWCRPYLRQFYAWPATIVKVDEERRRPYLIEFRAPFADDGRRRRAWCDYFDLKRDRR